MDNFIIYFTVYFILINITGFIIAGLDKYWAIRKKWRMAEKRFLLLAVMGGGLGVFTGCLIFNHKIRNRKFMIGIPAICITEAVVILLLIGKYSI
ncbi:MAG: DUF1294 domain-containing protein [Clostridiaceae bacterium]|nr:DUF1294 domain-containing protein [Clostridiaceae bacterium]